MCTLLCAYHAHPDYPLVIAANRDEYFQRPTAQAHVWPDAQGAGVLAGRDLQAGGTWLGITRQGRWAGLTNVRGTGRGRSASPRSRGHLVSEYLTGTDAPDAYARSILRRGHAYDAFNLLVGDSRSLWYVSNVAGKAEEVAPGVHGVSNHLLDTPWPKVVAGKRGLSEVLESESESQRDSDSGRVMADELLRLLANRDTYADHLLPDTGIGMELERNLSSLFIGMNDYGTCSSTAIVVASTRAVTFAERTTNPAMVAALEAAGERPLIVHTFSLP